MIFSVVGGAHFTVSAPCSGNGYLVAQDDQGQSGIHNHFTHMFDIDPMTAAVPSGCHSRTKEPKNVRPSLWDPTGVFSSSARSLRLMEWI